MAWCCICFTPRFSIPVLAASPRSDLAKSFSTNECKHPSTTWIRLAPHKPAAGSRSQAGSLRSRAVEVPAASSFSRGPGRSSYPSNMSMSPCAVPPGLIKSSFVIFRFTSEFSGRIPFCRGEFAPGRSVNLSENSVRADQEFCFNFTAGSEFASSCS